MIKLAHELDVDDDEECPPVGETGWAINDHNCGAEWFEEEPPPRRYLLKRGGFGVPRGVVGLLTGPGGLGKTQLMVELALAVATGRPWLGAFEIGTPGNVLLALAEEDINEVRRRLYHAARGLNLTADERELAGWRIHPLAFAGRDAAIVRRDRRGEMRRTDLFHDLAGRFLHPFAVGDNTAGGFALCVLDPLSRWCPGAESDNACASSAIDALATLTQFKHPDAADGPTVIMVHHSSKASRAGAKANVSSARGASALYDGVRFELQLSGRGDRDLALSFPKNNYGPPADPIPLVRGEHGMLMAAHPATLDNAEEREAEAAAAEAAARAQAAELRTHVLDAARAQPGLSLTALRKAARVRAGGAASNLIGVAVDAALDAGELVDRPELKGRKGHRYHVREGI